MSNKTRDVELEKRIDAYIKGNLTQEEVDELWARLLERPEYISLLQTEIDVARIYREKKEQKPATTHYWKWIAAAAAMILLVISINFFIDQSSQKPIQDWVQNKISLEQNLSSAEITRSATDVSSSDSLLNAGFKAAISGDKQQATGIYDKITTDFNDPELIAKAQLNLGILRYNSGEYEQSIQNLKMAVAHTRDNDLLKERSYWFMANAFIQIKQLKPARSAAYQAYSLGEIYREEANTLLQRLDEELGYSNDSFDK